ncbi:MAG: acetolactate synthase large subunit, partial [bacterium]|nr:acetolactate synthase large subunit [bacterium]
KGSISEQHPLCLGMMGMHGTAEANQAIQDADLLIALGMRFDDRVTGNPATYATGARKIHVDIDAAEIGKNVQVDVGIVGDARNVLDQLLDNLEVKDHAPWLEQIRSWKEDSRSRDLVNQGVQANLTAPEVLHDLWRWTEGEATTVTDVGQHQMWEAQYYLHSRPHTHITSGGMGTMGFGLPAAIGAKLAKPDEEVWAIVGDGGFQMTLAELATARQEKVEVKIAIINNGYLGMVRQWQEMFYERRYNATPMLSPDFCRLASSYGIPSVRVEHRDQIKAAVADAQAHRGGPFLVEFVVEALDAVYPMVPPGADLHRMIRRPKQS